MEWNVNMNRQVPCTNCGGMSPALWEDGNLIDGGLVISSYDIGYYGGFMDTFAEEPKNVFLCHDCSLLLMRTMTGLAKFLLPNRGGHPVNDNKPCCEYAWTFLTDENGESDAFVVGDDGEWKKLYPQGCD